MQRWIRKEKHRRVPRHWGTSGPKKKSNRPSLIGGVQKTRKKRSVTEKKTGSLKEKKTQQRHSHNRKNASRIGKKKKKKKSLKKVRKKKRSQDPMEKAEKSRSHTEGEARHRRQHAKKGK